MTTIRKKIYTHLFDLIESKALKPGDKLPAESELVRQFNSCRNTVREAYDELVHKGYVERKAGKGSFVLEKQQTKNLNIGIILPSLSTFDETFDPLTGRLKMDIFNGILKRAHETGSRISLHIPGQISSEADGYVSLHDDSCRDKLPDNAPIVVAPLGGADIRYNSISIDFEASFDTCLKYLFAKGYKKIGIVDVNVKGMSIWPTFKRIMKKHNLSSDHSWCKFYEKGGSSPYGKKAFEQLLESHPDIEAVFFRTDRAAIDALDYCKDKKINIPNDIAFLSFDNTQAAALCSPPLTTFDPHREEVGYQAMKKLEEIIANPINTTSIQYITGKIIERESC